MDVVEPALELRAMTSPNLPAGMQARLAEAVAAQGFAALRSAQAKTSAVYRAGGASDVAVPDAAAALAYAAVRMPATYAACVRAFDLAAGSVPDFAPRVHLDLGAGPGTAALAARAVWSTIESQTLVEPNLHLRTLGAGIVADMVEAGPVVSWRTDRIEVLGEVNAPADLVTLSYVLAELSEAEIESRLNGLRGGLERLLVIVEPGTPQGYERVLSARKWLLAQGAKIVAPCPHDQPCPLRKPDWCHFSVRLQRSAAHKALKDADVPYEDEPFAFVVASFDPELRIVRPAARLLADPVLEKGFGDLVLCAGDGRRVERRILRRDKAAFRAIRHAVSGDAFDG